ncbi:MAG TPA: sulfur carrier protein ThiS [Alloacidobacterium sp.]|nr:sulfur carrier protein ThiS [Alloacidobacterium sp.]
MQLVINGHSKNFTALSASATVADLVAQLGLKNDRVAIEHNGEIVPRSSWAETLLHAGDKLEIVHFVGGGYS